MKNLEWIRMSNERVDLYSGSPLAKTSELLASVTKVHNYYNEWSVYINGLPWHEQPTYDIGEEIIGLKNAKKITLEHINKLNK